MNRRINLTLTAALGIAGLLFVSLAPAWAATSSTTTDPQSGQALEIAPPLISLTVNPGQTITSQISLRDVSSGDLVVTNEVNDFVAAGEDGTPKILLNNDSNNPYSLKKWVSPLPSLLLAPHQIKNLTVTFHVPANASPGGHYGVIRFSGVPPELHSTGVSLQASLGSLVLITVRGNIKHALSVQEFSVNKNGKTGKLFQSAPVNFVEKIKNTGNVHEEPNGLVTIKNMFGKIVGAVNVNQPPKNVLPGSTRKFSEPVDKTAYGNSHLFGRYTATMDLKYASGQELRATTSFWIIPYKLISMVVAILVGGFFGLRQLMRRHDRRVMEQARRHNYQNRK